MVRFMAPASTSTSLQVDNLERGEHRLAVQVLANDQVVQSSAEQNHHSAARPHWQPRFTS